MTAPPFLVEGKKQLTKQEIAQSAIRERIRIKEGK